MKIKIFSILFAFALVFTGCGAKEETQSSMLSDVPENAEETSTEISFELEDQTEEALTFSWSFDEAEKRKFEEEEKSWRIIQNKGEKQEFSDQSYWHRFHESLTSGEVKEAPTGTPYFRICLFDEAAGKCLKYSEDIKIE